MKTGRGWWALAGMVGGSVVLLLGVYVGAYYATVKPVPGWESGRYGIVPHYMFGRNWIVSVWPIFEPIHQFDRRLRPKAWELDP